MPLETATYIHDLNAANPAHDDQLSAADSHLRLIKQVLLATLPTLTGPLTTSLGTLNALDTTAASLQGQITAEVNNRTSAVANEASLRSNADAAEANARAAQDGSLFNDYVARIAAEASARATGDTNLQNQLVNYLPFNAITISSTPGGIVAAVGNTASGALPILIQTRSFTLATGNGDIWSFPVPFSSGVWGIYGTSLAGSSVPGSVVSIATLNNNGCKVWLNGPGGPGFSGGVSLLAIGQ